MLYYPQHKKRLVKQPRIPINASYSTTKLGYTRPRNLFLLPIMVYNPFCMLM